MAVQLAERAGIKVTMLITHEDISAGIDTPAEDKRGLAGAIPLYKVAGAAAEAGKSLDEVFEIAERFSQQMATLAVAVSNCTHPQTGQAISALADDEMEIGMGQHGEAGGGISKMLTADQTAERMILPLIEATKATNGDTVQLLINGVGANIVKIYYCDGFEKITASCPVPIVIAGGKKLPEPDALELCYNAINDGASGVDMGRNVFQPDALSR